MLLVLVLAVSALAVPSMAARASAAEDVGFSGSLETSWDYTYTWQQDQSSTRFTGIAKLSALTRIGSTHDYAADVAIGGTNIYTYRNPSCSATHSFQRAGFYGPPDQQWGGAMLWADADGVRFQPNLLWVEENYTSTCEGSTPGQTLATVGGFISGQSWDAELTNDTDPAPDRLVGTMEWTLSNPPAGGGRLPSQITNYTFTVTYDLTLGAGPTPTSDRDGDGVADGVDDCPHDFGRTSSGCPAPSAGFGARWVGTSGKDNRIQFDGGRSSGVDLVYHWDFGDGTTGVGVAPVHTYEDAGSRVVVLTVIDRTNQRATTDEYVVGNPVYRYAPEVRLHKKERFFPMDPGEFFRSSALWWHHSGCPDHRIATRRQLTASKLKAGKWSHKASSANGCAHRGRSYPANELTAPAKDGEPEKSPPGREGFYLNVEDSLWRGEVPRSNRSYRNAPPVYYDYEPNRYIVYWLFYGFSGRRGDKHEGDWERVVARLDDRDTIAESAYYQHFCDPLKANSSYGVRRHPGGFDEHLVAWSALSGHPHFPEHVGVDVLPCPGDAGVYDRTSKTGPVWKTWKAPLKNIRQQSWYGLGVGWGARIGGVTGWGPLGPGEHMEASGSPGAPRAWH